MHLHRGLHHTSSKRSSNHEHRAAGSAPVAERYQFAVFESERARARVVEDHTCCILQRGTASPFPCGARAGTVAGMGQPSHRFIPHRPPRLSPEETLARAQAFYETMDRRRSVRQFSADPVPREAIEWAIKTASTAPSGAHRQPWRFVVIDDAAIKREIRIAAEEEERRSYEGGRMPPEWIEALAPLGTDWRKPYLEVVPYIVVVFEEVTGFGVDGAVRKNYYVKESCGLACGLFVAALHQMGLATLTHTPSPMGFLTRILGRPKHEKPFILFPIGYPASDAEVPDIGRKSLEEIAVWNPRPERRDAE
jgi:iodotyrosine deiodinase